MHICMLRKLNTYYLKGGRWLMGCSNKVIGSEPTLPFATQALTKPTTLRWSNAKKT